MWKKGSVCKVLLNGWTLWFPLSLLWCCCLPFVSHHRGGGNLYVADIVEWDRLIVTHLFYQPAPGDIVVIVQPESDTPAIIKRIIAVEGQTVDINFSFGTVTVDGQVLEEPYINEPTYMKRDVNFPVTVPPGMCFCHGRQSEPLFG